MSDLPSESTDPPDEPAEWRMSSRQRRCAAFFLSLALAALVASVVVLLTFRGLRAETLRSATEDASGRAALAARVLDAELVRLHQAVEEAAGSPDPEAALPSLLRARPGLVGAAVTRPGGGGAALLRLGSSVQPGDLGLPPGDLEPGWHEPFMHEELDLPVAALSVPLRASGTLAVLVSTRHLRDVLDETRPGEGCIPFVLTRTGRFVTHPMRELMDGGPTLFEVSSRYHLPVLAEAGRHLLAEPSGVLKDSLGALRSPLFTFFRRLPSTGWVVCINWTETRLIGGGRAAGLWIVLLGLLGGTFVSSLAAWRAARSWRGDNHRPLWAAVLLLSLVLLSGTVLLWSLVLKGWLARGEEPRRLTDQGLLAPVREDALRDARAEGQAAPVLVPTGILVQTLEFVNANDVALSGFVWQRLTRGVHDGIEPGVVFPEATVVDQKEAWRRPVPDGEVVGWRFRAVLRQAFDYVQFPLDREDVWVRMWPKEFDRDVILEPHLDSYPVMNPENTPGVDVGLVLSGWEPLESYFDYRYNLYTTNFGTERDLETPELYFNLILQRNFLTAFVSTLIPLFVISGLLFGVLSLARCQEPEGSKSGFSMMGMMNSCAGLFFAVVLAHNNVRGQFSASQSILYLEWFYFLLYGAILAVAVVGYLVHFHRAGPLVEFGDCLLPRLLYWPLLLGSILAVTILTFL